MRILSIGLCLALVAAPFSPAHAQARPNGEGLARWCDRGRCMTVAVANPETMQQFCVELMRMEQEVIDEHARRARHDETPPQANATESSIALRSFSATTLNATEVVFRGYAQEARCSSFAPATSVPAVVAAP